MQKFSIYTKTDKFYWSPESIIYLIIFSSLGLMIFKEKFLQIEQNFIDKVFSLLAVGGFLVGIILKIYNFNKIEPLRGKLEGYLSLEKTSITVGKENYPIEKVRNIQISNDDYVGKMAYTSKGNFGPALSNGIHNYIIIYFETGKSKRYDFEMNNSDDFQKLRETLIDYHLIGKIEYWELAKVLGEKSTSDTLALTDEIKKRRATVKL